MASIDKTAYPRFSKYKRLTHKQLAEIYTPSADEIHIAEKHTKDDRNKINFLILLKGFQRLGYFPSLDQIPRTIIKHILTTLDFDEDYKISYASSKTRHSHKQVIRELLSVTPFNDDAKRLSEKTAEEASYKMDNLADIINVVIEELVFNRFELPAFIALDRLAKRFKAKANSNIFTIIANRIPEDIKALFDATLKSNGNSNATGYNLIKGLPKKATVRNFHDFLSHHNWLTSFGNVSGYLVNISKTKIKEFSNLANSLDASDMKRTKNTKRYSLMSCLLYELQSKAKDSLAKMFCRTIYGMHKKAKAKLEQLLQDHRGKIAEALELLHELLNIIAFPDQGISEEIKNKVKERGGVESLLKLCDELMAYLKKDYLFLLPQFLTQPKKKVLFGLLRALKICTTTNDDSSIKAIQHMLKNENNKEDHIECSIDTSFFPKAWNKLIIINRDKESILVRRHFEICILTHVANELRSGDLCIENADAFSDYRTQLVDKNLCQGMVKSYCNEMGLPNNQKDFVRSLKGMLLTESKKLDENYENIEEFIIDENGNPMIKKKKKEKKGKNAYWLKKEIEHKIPERNILDILCSTNHYADWARFFGPLSGSEPKMNKSEEKHIFTSFVYGSSIGPTQGAKHLKGEDISAHILSWINRRHVSLRSLNEAGVCLIDIINQFELIKTWGDGKTSAADGTLCHIYEDNLMAEFHVRYNQKGGIAYYHIANNYIAIFSSFISCGVWEAVAILDGILNNKSEVQPNVVHADTQGQSKTAFGFGYLLGIKLMPRIRNWKDLTLFRPHQSVKYKNIDSLFTDTIKWEIIEDHWEDMMQVILSIKAGKISTSFLLQRLSNYSRKNKLFRAFEELGKVIRTLYLIEFISNADLREEITASTNKVEEFNGFSAWLRFGTEYYMVASNDPDEQEKAVKYNVLLANAVILQNVVDITNIIVELINEGIEITKEDTALLSPYITGHIKRFGDYFMEYEQARLIAANQEISIWKKSFK